VKFTIGLAASVALALAFTGCVSPKKPVDVSSSMGPVLKSEFIYETAPYPACHASTIESTPTGLVAAWFGGTHEKHPDVGIWVSRHDGTKWLTPVEVANGVQADGKTRHPTWNPVLFQAKNGPLLLFYKVGPSPSRWWGMLIKSSDGGKSWSAPQRLPDEILGPIRAKPVLLADGTLLCPSSSEHDGWRVHMETTRDLGATWTKTEALNDGKEFGAIQPTVLFHPGNRLQALNRSRQGRVTEIWSEDGGKKWSSMKATSLLNPSAGIDGVTLKDGRHLLVYNPVSRGRTPLVLGISKDGKEWQTALTLEGEPGEYSYPAIIQAPDGKVHITYTWQRKKIRYWAVDPAKL
jgi:predicted neuraminidase